MSKLKNAIEYACTITKLSLHISTASPRSLQQSTGQR